MRTGGIVCGLIVLLASAGCGGGETSPPQPQVKTYATVPELARAISAATAAQRYATVRLPIDGAAVTVLYAEDPPGTAVTAATLESTATAVKIVRTQDAVYYQLGNAPGAPPTGQWTRHRDGPASSETSRMLLEGLEGMEVRMDDLNLGRTLAAEADAITLDAATPEPLDGAPTVRYDLTVDNDKLSRTLPEPHRSVLQRAVAAGTRTSKLVLWLDHADLPLETKQGEASALFTLWGTRVEVAPPPADQVVDVK